MTMMWSTNITLLMRLIRGNIGRGTDMVLFLCGVKVVMNRNGESAPE